MLNISVESFGNQVILHCQGRLVNGHETKLLCTTMQQKAAQIIVDLCGVTAMDAAGIGALVSLQVAGFYLKLTNPSRPVRELLTRTKLDSVFEIIETESIDTIMRSTAAEAAVSC